MIKSPEYPEKSPEWTLHRFFDEWKKRDWKEMLNYCQITWRTVPQNTKKKLFTQFRHKFISARILKVEEISEVTRDISVEICYKDINVRRRIRRKARLICELAPMKPSTDGTWGVNPLSMKRAR